MTPLEREAFFAAASEAERLIEVFGWEPTPSTLRRFTKAFMQNYMRKVKSGSTTAKHSSNEQAHRGVSEVRPYRQLHLFGVDPIAM